MSSKPPGVERCAISRGVSGWVLEGDLVRRFREGPAVISCRVETDGRWKTGSAHAELVLRGESASVTVEMKGSKWYVDGSRDESLDGCADVDLGASPVTNTLPIRRLRPEVGSMVSITAAWVRFPGLSVVALHQSYERVGERRYVYRSATGFRSEIEVDGFGGVRRYGDYWQARPVG